jgi:enoyl-CoA hydratase/carnithine racemase
MASATENPDGAAPQVIDTVPGSQAPVEVERVATAGAEAAIVWLSRPDALNAIDSAMVLALDVALRELDADESVRVVFVTGRGRAFSAGGDLTAYLELQQDAVAFPRFLDDLHAAFGMIRTMSKPVVALVNGVTAAGGLELLLSCDFAFAARSAQIGDAHLNYGQMGGGGVLALLPRIIGPARARELIFSGEFLSAGQAAELGLVNRVVSDDALIATGIEFARGVAMKSAAAVAAAKSVLNNGWADGTGLDSALRLERERTALYCLTLPDSHEGLLAFAERRRARAARRS